MVTTVYQWEVDAWGAGRPTNAEAVIPSEPTVNASSDLLAGQDVQPILVDAWNRHHPETPRTLADFAFVLPPEGWRNPNDPADDPLTVADESA